MAGLLPSARGPDREVRVEKPGLPSAGLLFWCSGAFTGPLLIWDQIGGRRRGPPWWGCRDSVGFRPGPPRRPCRLCL